MQVKETVSKNLVEEKMGRVIDKMMHLDAPDAKKYQNLSVAEAEKIGYFARDFGMNHWDWPQGVGLFGLSLMNGKYENYLRQWAEQEVAKGLPEININTTCPVMTVMDFPEYEELSQKWMTGVLQDLPRTAEGGLEHTTTGSEKGQIKRMDGQIWADTVFMTLVFMAKMAHKYQRQDWVDETVYQVLVHTKYLLDRPTGLFYHGWNFTNNSNFGGNFWCRGNSWLTMGIPLIVETLDAELSDAVKEYLVTIYKKQIATLMTLRDDTTKLWHTILTDPTSYIETSGSAGIVAGIYFGMMSGILDKAEYGDFCEESIGGLLAQIDEGGAVQGVSAGTAISENPNNYKEIMVQPMAYGQSLTLCALNGYLLTK